MNELRNLILALQEKNRIEGCSALHIEDFCREALCLYGADVLPMGNNDADADEVEAE